MAAFSVLRKFLLFFCLLCLSLPALAQTLQDELLKVREALETASTADEQKALEDYLRILEIYVSREPARTTRPDSRLSDAITNRNLAAFMQAMREQAEPNAGHLMQIVKEYASMTPDSSLPAIQAQRATLLEMADVLFKSEVALTGTRLQVLSRWFDMFALMVPRSGKDESGSDMFEKLLTYMPDEITSYQRPSDGMSLVHLYVRPPVESYLSLMLKLGCNKMLKNNQGQTPLEYLRSNGQVPEWAETLLRTP